jgi:phosphate transport system substrate-binding protein
VNLSKIALAAGLVAAAVSFGSAQAADISGAGATFPYPIYAKWADVYKKETNIGLNYQSIGSGGGIKQIKAKTVTFGATDSPLKPEELDAAGLFQFPTVVGGVVPVINVPGVKAGEVVLDGQTLADIFQGKITSWDDAAIKKLNSSVKLPSTAIAVVHRSDGSGTSFNFTNYLAHKSADWKDNEGVAAGVGQTVGSIGYVEYAYAMQNKMTYTKLINADGKPVDPKAENFAAAASSVKWSEAPGYYVVITDEPGAKSWPITAATFILVYKKPDDAVATAEALKFFSWAYAKGGKLASDLDYIMLSKDVIKGIEADWAKNVVDANGKPVYVAAK